MKLRQGFAVVALGTASAVAFAVVLDVVARFARAHEGATSLRDAVTGSTGVWHTIAVEAPLRTLAPLLATALALRVASAPLARFGALVGALTGAASSGAFAVLDASTPPVFTLVIAALFGASVGACAAELRNDPHAGSPLVLAWVINTGAVATLITANTARVRAAVFLASLASLALTAGHAFLQRRRRRLRDDVGATLTLASRTLQSLASWSSPGAAVGRLSLRWLAFGVLTTLGVLVTASGIAVASGRALGLDFATFEQEGGASNADLAFFGAFVLAAFAVAGWLLGRVSSRRSPSEAILGPLLVVPVVVAALPTGRAGFVVTLVYGAVAALLVAAGAVMARRTSA